MDRFKPGILAVLLASSPALADQPVDEIEKAALKSYVTGEEQRTCVHGPLAEAIRKLRDENRRLREENRKLKERGK